MDRQFEDDAEDEPGSCENCGHKITDHAEEGYCDVLIERPTLGGGRAVRPCDCEDLL